MNPQPLKICVVAILSLAWLAASNHCAIAALSGGHVSAEHSCCAKSKSPKPAAPCAEKCCGGMAAPVAVADIFLAPGLSVVAFLSDVLTITPGDSFLEGLSGPSPPGRCAGFFVEFVLGRSQQPLAPPVFVA
ncbi:MAG: hypothetical protein ACOYM3_02955 [Terrimicrobiaceae bacterium]